MPDLLTSCNLSGFDPHDQEEEIWREERKVMRLEISLAPLGSLSWTSLSYSRSQRKKKREKRWERERDGRGNHLAIDRPFILCVIPLWDLIIWLTAKEKKDKEKKVAVNLSFSFRTPSISWLTSPAWTATSWHTIASETRERKRLLERLLKTRVCQEKEKKKKEMDTSRE